jgi:DNA-binding NtrC family response regulator
MPPLREREGDVLLLACHFLAHYGAEAGRPQVRFHRDAVQALQRAGWPGNVRELINRVRRALVVTDGLEITAADLGFEGDRHDPMPSLREVRARAESRCIEEALRRHAFRKCETARALGISRTRLYELMRSHGLLDPPSE